jgi:23S rRNA (adenine1618-N6)-methyltransferase
MPTKSHEARQKNSLKNGLHKSNAHKQGYDFTDLKKRHAPLANFIIKNSYNQQDTINFSDNEAVKSLNLALLKTYYQIEQWYIPDGYLCPPIPGRVDYIHYLHDLLTTSKSALAIKTDIKVLDIGTGASCIYPILGQRIYGWHFTASDIDPISIKVAQGIIKANKGLHKAIDCRLQGNSEHIFTDIIQQGEFYHLTLCNPPFHKSLADARQGTMRKWNNLNKQSSFTDNTVKQNNSTLNFGGQKAELWCQGGELAFIRNMIKESKRYQKQVLWFTCLVSKKDNLSKIKLSLKKANVKEVRVVNMAQGQKISRFIAWRFIDCDLS